MLRELTWDKDPSDTQITTIGTLYYISSQNY